MTSSPSTTPALDDFEILPAHLERAAFADPAQYRFRTLYDTDPTNPGLYTAPTASPRVAPGSHIVLEPQSRPGGARSRRSAASWSGPSRTPRRSKPICSPAGSTWWRANSASRSTGARLREAAWRPFTVLYKPGLILRACRAQSRQAASSPTNACARRCSTASTARRSASSFSPAASRSRKLRSAARLGLYRRCAALPLRPGQGARAARRRRLAAARRRHPPQRRRQAADARPRHHRGQPHRELVEQVLQSQWRADRHRGAHQEPAGARPVRRER